MDEWVTALVTAVAALGGSSVAGLFTVLGARRQADAAVTAALETVNGQLRVMEHTLRDQAAAAQRTVRRTAYVAFLNRADHARHAHAAWVQSPDAARRDAWTAAAHVVDETLNVVRLEGPADVATAAEAMAAALAPPGTSAVNYPQAHNDFLNRARTALQPPV
ncbi:hypothetical protein [Streptomyces sp. NPDC051001]|uniref:hypothetical protein n=1 Tax=Streptomyces sp. NPDC051001 TaxID=3155795 RepID=UPI00341FBA96